MDPEAFDRLTERQRQCLRLVAAGKRSKTIGIALGISHLTVDQHVKAAMARLGAATREDAAAMLVRHEQTAWVAYPQRLATESATLAAAPFAGRIGPSAIANDMPPPGSLHAPLDVVREDQASYRATGFGVDDLLRLPLRTAERPRNDLSPIETLLAVAKLIVMLAIGAVTVAAIVDTLTKIYANLN